MYQILYESAYQTVPTFRIKVIDECLIVEHNNVVKEELLSKANEGPASQSREAAGQLLKPQSLG